MPMPVRQLADEALLKHAGSLCEHVMGVYNKNIMYALIQES